MNLYNINHFLQIWILPSGLILLIFLFGVLLSSWRPRVGKNLIIFGLIFFWLLCTPVISELLMKPLQGQYPPLNLTNVNPDDSAIVILGAGLFNTKQYTHKHSLSALSAQRMDYAAFVNEKTKVPIITSGGNRDKYGYTEAEGMRDELIANHKIQPLALEDKSRNTREESQFLVPIIKNNNIKHLYVVTHAYHMPRSMYIFQKTFKDADVEIIPAPMGYVSLLSNDKVANYMPSMNALGASVNAMHEYIGLIWYII